MTSDNVRDELFFPPMRILTLRRYLCSVIRRVVDLHIDMNVRPQWKVLGMQHWYIQTCQYGPWRRKQRSACLEREVYRI